MAHINGWEQTLSFGDDSFEDSGESYGLFFTLDWHTFNFSRGLLLNGQTTAGLEI